MQVHTERINLNAWLTWYCTEVLQSDSWNYISIQLLRHCICTSHRPDSLDSILQNKVWKCMPHWHTHLGCSIVIVMSHVCDYHWISMPWRLTMPSARRCYCLHMHEHFWKLLLISVYVSERDTCHEMHASWNNDNDRQAQLHNRHISID